MVRAVGDDEKEQRVINDISEFGWHCVNILADSEGPEYAFTVGAYHTFGIPELVIFGIPKNVAHQILTNAITGLRTGAIKNMADPTDELLNGYDCRFAKVPESSYQENVGFCRWYYEGNSFPLYQIVWPSKSGYFPWDKEATESFHAIQPLIGVR